MQLLCFALNRCHVSLDELTHTCASLLCTSWHDCSSSVLFCCMHVTTSVVWLLPSMLHGLSTWSDCVGQVPSHPEYHCRQAGREVLAAAGSSVLQCQHSHTNTWSRSRCASKKPYMHPLMIIINLRSTCWPCYTASPALMLVTQLYSEQWVDAECMSTDLLCCFVGNVIFLPRGAVVIDIVPENNEDKSPWVVYMCADFKPLFISPITIPPQKTVLQMAKVRRTKEWAMLSPYWRQRILREGVCPEVH